MRQDYPANGFRICVDTEEQDMAGRIYSLLVPEVITYSGWNELFLKMDAVFDQVGYPQAFQEKRSFTGGTKAASYQGSPKLLQPYEAVTHERGLLWTVDVVVISRRDTSWQGIVYDLDRQELGQFDRGARTDENIRTERETNGRVEASVRFFFCGDRMFARRACYCCGNEYVSGL